MATPPTNTGMIAARGARSSRPTIASEAITPGTMVMPMTGPKTLVMSEVSTAPPVT